MYGSRCVFFFVLLNERNEYTRNWRWVAVENTIPRALMQNRSWKLPIGWIDDSWKHFRILRPKQSGEKWVYSEDWATVCIKRLHEYRFSPLTNEKVHFWLDRDANLLRRWPISSFHLLGSTTSTAAGFSMHQCNSIRGNCCTRSMCCWHRSDLPVHPNRSVYVGHWFWSYFVWTLHVRVDCWCHLFRSMRNAGQSFAFASESQCHRSHFL